jgi:hypothetical protein
MAVFAGAGLWAQEEKKDKPEAVEAARAQQSVVRVYQVNPGNITGIRNTLMNIGIKEVSANSGVLIVRTSADLAPAVDAIVTKLNSAPAPKNVELTFYILQGFKEPSTEGDRFFASPDPAVRDQTPSGLHYSLLQLQSAFDYRSFRLLDTAFMRGRSGQRVILDGRVSGIVKDLSDYTIQAELATSSDAKPSTIRVDNLQVRIRTRIPGIGLRDIGFTANLDFKEGQNVVVGKTGIEGNQSALIVVATGKVVD